MLRVSRHLVPVGLLLILGGCPAGPARMTARPFSMEGSTLRHVASGQTFPIMAGRFARATPRQYNVAGTDVSVGYNALGGPASAVATIYIYPAPSLVSIGSPDYVVAGARRRLLRTEYERRKREIEESPDYLGVTIVAERPIILPASGRSNEGWLASYTYAGAFGGGIVPVFSELEVSCFIADEWCVEYRVSRPRATMHDSPGLADFQAALPLTIGHQAEPMGY